MSIKDQIFEKIEEPSRINYSNFYQEYINLSEKYWSLADEDFINAINEAQEEVFKNRQLKVDCGMFNNLSTSQILGIFHKRRIAVYETISQKIADYILNKIDQYLRKNQHYAAKMDMFIPTNQHLSTYQYYYNYVLAKKTLKIVSLPVLDKLKK